MPMRSIDTGTLKKWLDAGEAVLIDVREPAEHKAENIPGAALLPLARVSAQSLPVLKGKRLVIHCRSGRRSGSACEKLIAEAPELEVYNLEGGITAWAQAGHEVVRSGKFFLPLDRQVQLVIGLSVLAGSLLCFYISPWFFLLTGFFGLGLTFAGLTGTCGLALLMARMPWNQQGKAEGDSCRIIGG